MAVEGPQQRQRVLTMDLHTYRSVACTGGINTRYRYRSMACTGGINTRYRYRSVACTGGINTRYRYRSVACTGGINTGPSPGFLLTGVSLTFTGSSQAKRSSLPVTAHAQRSFGGVKHHLHLQSDRLQFVPDMSAICSLTVYSLSLICQPFVV